MLRLQGDCAALAGDRVSTRLRHLARLVGRDMQSDIAVLKIDVDANKRLRPVELGRIKGLQVYAVLLINERRVSKTNKVKISMPNFNFQIKEMFQVHVFTIPSSIQVEIVLVDGFTETVIDVVPVEVPGQHVKSLTCSCPLVQKIAFSKLAFEKSKVAKKYVAQSTKPDGVLTEAQKKKYLVPQAKGEKIATYGLTEPNAGSDAVGGLVHRGDERSCLTRCRLDEVVLDFLADDRPDTLGLTGSVRQPAIGPVPEIVEVRQRHARKVGDVGVDVARHADVDDVQRARVVAAGFVDE